MVLTVNSDALYWNLCAPNTWHHFLLPVQLQDLLPGAMLKLFNIKMTASGADTPHLVSVTPLSNTHTH